MSHETYKTTRNEEFDPAEGQILIRFRYHAGRPATRTDPAEPDEIDILKIEDSNGNDITDLISEAEFSKIEDELYDNWENDSADAEADYRYEQYREERDLLVKNLTGGDND